MHSIKLPCSKLSICLVLGIFSQLAIANPAVIPDKDAAINPVPVRAFSDGFYGGVLLGGSFAKTTWSGASTLLAQAPFDTPNIIFSALDLQAANNLTNFAGRIFFGYELVRSELLLAAELGGTFAQSYQFNNVNANFASTIDTVNGVYLDAFGNAIRSASLGNAEFNIDIKPGYLVKENLLLFSRLGVAFNTMKISDIGIWNSNIVLLECEGECPIPPAFASSFGTNRQDVTGIRIGVGAEYLFTDNLGLIVDYTYTRYGTISTQVQGTQNQFSYPNYAQQVIGSDAATASFSTQAVMAGLTYHY